MSQMQPPSYSPGFEDPMLAEPPAWPKVVGIISIVLGSLWLTCLGCSSASSVVFTPMLEKQMGEPIPPPMQPSVLHWLVTGVGVATSGLLLIAGIMTVMRRTEGRALHLLYAIIEIPLTIASAVIQVEQMNKMAQWVANNPDSKWAQQQSSPGASIGGWIGLVVGLAISAGYPIFLLIWFGMVKRRAADMTGGAVEPAA